MVSITVDHKQQVSIRAGAAFFQITAMDSEDYPELPDVNGKSGVTMPQSALKAMISGTIFSVSENQARPIQTGCLMEVTEDSVTMVAVDSFRLARRTWHTENAANHTLKFVVPAAGLKEIERILEDSDEPVTFTLGDKHILFSIGDALLVSRVLEGEFIDWRRVVPTNCGTVLTANVAELTSSIERVSLIISEKVKSPVRCVLGDNMADFRTANTIRLRARHLLHRRERRRAGDRLQQPLPSRCAARHPERGGHAGAAERPEPHRLHPVRQKI